MTFYINLTNGTSLATIADGTIDSTSTSITLVGKNFPTYGQLLNQDLVSMLENFSNSTSPTSPLIGQIWYDSANNVLKFYRGGTSNSYWQTLANVISSDIIPSTAQQGDFWWNTSSQQLNYYDNLEWIVVGPQTTSDGLNRVSGTNSFIVQIGGNNVFTVDANGRVNAAYNPVVQGTGRSGSVIFTGSGLLSPATWIPNTVSLNVGSYFNVSTGVFTCPVSGVYQVMATMESLGYSGSATTQSITWWLNQSDSGISSRAKNTTAVVIPMSASGYLNCKSGDLIQLVVAAESNGQIDYSNSSLSIRLVA